MPDQMIRLYYSSTVFPFTAPDEVIRIVRAAQANNERNGITGMLCYDGRYFIQVLEGPRNAVSALMKRIMADERHMDVTLISCAPMDRPLFDKWSMVLIGEDVITEEICQLHGGEKQLAPANMTADQIKKFVAEIYRTFAANKTDAA